MEYAYETKLISSSNLKYHPFVSNYKNNLKIAMLAIFIRAKFDDVVQSQCGKNNGDKYFLALKATLVEKERMATLISFDLLGMKAFIEII